MIDPDEAIVLIEVTRLPITSRDRMARTFLQAKKRRDSKIAPKTAQYSRART